MHQPRKHKRKNISKLTSADLERCAEVEHTHNADVPVDAVCERSKKSTSKIEKGHPLKVKSTRKSKGGWLEVKSKSKSKSTGRPLELAFNDEEEDCLEAVLTLKAVCTSKWTGELVQKLEKDKLEEEYNLKTYLKKRLMRHEFKIDLPPPKPKSDASKKRKKPTNSNTTDTEGKPANAPPPLPRVPYGSHEWISIKLCLAAVAVYVRQRDDAFLHLKACKKGLSLNHSDVSKSHQNAYKYLMDTLHWSISALFPPGPRKPKFSAQYPGELELKEGAENLSEVWNGLNKDSKSLAAVLYVKAYLCKVIGLDEMMFLSKVKKAAEMEPDFYLWHLLIYENIRMIRKREGKELAPRSDEIEACKKAYELCNKSENKIKVTFDWAQLRKEKLRFSSEIDRLKARVEGNAIIQLFKEVIDNPLSTETCILNAHILTAEMYTMKGSSLDAEEGKNFFMECYRRWPKVSSVLHKVGKFYYYGIRGGKFVDMKMAKKIYLEGLQAAPTNFPCLMDYLKLLGTFEVDYNQIIDSVDHYRNFQKAIPERMVKLLVLRGFCYWLRNGEGTEEEERNKMSAAENWVEALVKFPRHWGMVTDMITIEQNDVFGSINIDLKRVLYFVRRFCKKEKIPRIGSIDDFANEIEDKLKQQ